MENSSEKKSSFQETRKGLLRVLGTLQKSKEDNNNIDFTDPQVFERYYKNVPSVFTGFAANYFLKTKDSAGNTLLHAAAFLGKEKEIEHILSCAFTTKQKIQLISAVNKEDEDALHFYLKYVGLNNKKYLADLKDQQDNNNQNENLHIPDYKYQIFEMFIECADLSRLVKGNSYLMYALNEQVTEKLCWLICNTTKSATYVTEHLATKKILTITKPLDLSVKNLGITAYHLAAKLGYHDLIRTLPAITSYENIGFLTQVDVEAENKSFGQMKSMVLALNTQALINYLKDQPKSLGIDLLNRVDKETQRTLLGILANMPEAAADKIEAMAEVLCGNGALPDYAINGAPTPLFDAVLGGNIKLATYLKAKGAGITGADIQWNNIVHTAVLSKNDLMVKLVLSWFLSDTELRSRFRTVVKTPNANNRTALGLSMEQGTFSISTRIIHAYENCGKVSMEQVSVIDENEELPISVLNLRDSAGNNYLLQAIVNNDLSGFKFALSQKNKDLFKMPSNEGKTYLHVIFEMKLLSFLRDEKNKKNVLSPEQMAAYVIPFFASTDKKDNIPFHYLLSLATSAEEHNKIEEMFWMLWRLANHDEDDEDNDLLLVQNSEQRTILHEICAYGYKDSLNKLLATPKVLVKHTDIQDKNGFTPLHQAVMSGENEMVLMFLGHSERVSLKLDKEGYSFFHRIIMSRNVELWEAVLDKLRGMDILDQLMKLLTRDDRQTVLHLIMADKEKGEEFFNILVEKTGDSFIHNLLDAHNAQLRKLPIL